MMAIQIHLRRYDAVKRLLDSYDFNTPRGKRRWGGFKSSLMRNTKKAWKEAVADAWKGTGRDQPTRLPHAKAVATKTYSFELVTPPHAIFFWKGTKRSRGRFIPSIEKRFRKDRIPLYLKLYGERFVGWHPGISTKRFPLKRMFYAKLRKKIQEAAKRWFGGKV